MNPIIKIENLSKVYKIGSQKKSQDTLGEMIVQIIKSPIRRLKYLRGELEDDETAFWALKNVSFDVEFGDVVGIIGRNGAGKSTLLKILSKITEPTEGRIFLNGRVVSLLEVGTGFHPDLTGRENIYLNGAILGMKREEINRKFDEIVDFSEIEKFIDTPVKRYSSGMYVRLAFAVAAHLEPEILIVDEVLAVGDFQFQKKCMNKMEGIGKSGRTILFVSHNMSAIRSLCNKGVLLIDGSCAFIGMADAVVDQYINTVNVMSGAGNEIKSRMRQRPGLPTGMRMINIEIESDKHGQVNQIEAMDGITLKIDYEIISDIDYFAAEWRIKDVYGMNLSYSSSSPMGNVLFYPKNGEKFGQVRCRIEKIPLAIGEYIIEASLTKPGVKYFDNLDDACRLIVIASDPLKTGYTYKKELAPFYIDCSWTKHSI